MKLVLLLAICVVLGLFNGCSNVLDIDKRTVQAAVVPTPVPTPAVEQSVRLDTTHPEPETAEPKFNIQMLETGEFHGDEVNARSGETWLALFDHGKEAELIECRIKVTTVFDQIVDDEQKGEKTGKAVSVARKKEPIFLLRNANFLKPSKVKTVFYYDSHSDEPSDDSSLTNQTRKTFNLNKVNYALFVKTTADNESYLDKSSTLILTDGKTEQTIYSQTMCDDCGWAIYWAGDLDADGKLDLYLDLHDHYNVNHRRLFLSSLSENGALVKEVANFVTVGC